MTNGPDNSLEWASSSPKFYGTIGGQCPLRIISVGNEKELLRLREQVIIKGTGLKVQSVSTDEADGPAHSPDSQVWVFCSSVQLGPLIYLASAVRRYSPGSRLVLLEGVRPPLGSEAALFDRILDPFRSVESLVETLRELATASR